MPDPVPVQDFSLPSWTPGSYLLREFARYVVTVSAAADESVPVEKIDHCTWRCRDVRGALTVSLRIYALDQSVRGAYVDTTRAFFNGACVFPSLCGREQEAIEVVIEPPPGPATAVWRVATAMRPVSVDERGFGTYAAADYEELIDHPVEIGEFASVAFQAGGVPHQLVIAGRHETDLERIATDLGQLCAVQIEMFGPPAPFDQYWFLGLAVGDGYGGLEHRASSSLIFSRDDLPKLAEPGTPKAYQRFLGLVSHEYFHSWNIKRIKPAAFTPYRLNERNHTRLLWVFEGITSYYQDLLLLRSSLIGTETYLARLGEALTRVLRVPGRARQSLAQSSFDAWDCLYKPEAHSVNTGISYYTKGALVALALDLRLRRDTSNAQSLDTVMRTFWQRYADTAVPEDGFEQLVIELAGPAFAAFFAATVRGTEDPPLSELLADFGVRLLCRPSMGPEDKGGAPAPAAAAGHPLTLGVLYRGAEGGIELVQVFEGGPAHESGLIPRDLLVALDGLRINEKNLAARLQRCVAGHTVEVAVFRGDELRTHALVLAPAPLDTCHLELAAAPSTEARARRLAWLGA